MLFLLLLSLVLLGFAAGVCLLMHVDAVMVCAVVVAGVVVVGVGGIVLSACVDVVDGVVDAVVGDAFSLAVAILLLLLLVCR